MIPVGAALPHGEAVGEGLARADAVRSSGPARRPCWPAGRCRASGSTCPRRGALRDAQRDGVALAPAQQRPGSEPLIVERDALAAGEVDAGLADAEVELGARTARPACRAAGSAEAGRCSSPRLAAAPPRARPLTNVLLDVMDTLPEETRRTSRSYARGGFEIGRGRRAGGEAHRPRDGREGQRHDGEERAEPMPEHSHVPSIQARPRPPAYTAKMGERLIDEPEVDYGCLDRSCGRPGCRGNENRRRAS